jgi:hypothetical protein
MTGRDILVSPKPINHGFFDPRWLTGPTAGILKPAVFGDEAIA